MIRYKFGTPDIAVRNPELYSAAVLQASLVPPVTPAAEWRILMDKMAAQAHGLYRSLVWEEPDFVPYFRQTTPRAGSGQAAFGQPPGQTQIRQRGREPSRHPLDLRLDPNPPDVVRLAR